MDCLPDTPYMISISLKDKPGLMKAKPCRLCGCLPKVFTFKMPILFRCLPAEAYPPTHTLLGVYLRTLRNPGFFSTT